MYFGAVEFKPSGIRVGVIRWSMGVCKTLTRISDFQDFASNFLTSLLQCGNHTWSTIVLTILSERNRKKPPRESSIAVS